MKAWDSISRAVDEAWIADQARTLVEIPSPTGAEQQACDCYARQLRELGLDVDAREVTPSRPNLYARIAGAGGGRLNRE
jgi:acetylornithine deacetylase/succinyl-diaminopimelate desuccinylase-like protein